MNIKCPSCSTQFVIPDDRITEQGTKVKCSRCSHLFMVRRKAAGQTSIPKATPSASVPNSAPVRPKTKMPTFDDDLMGGFGGGNDLMNDATQVMKSGDLPPAWPPPKAKASPAIQAPPPARAPMPSKAPPAAARESLDDLLGELSSLTTRQDLADPSPFDDQTRVVSYRQPVPAANQPVKRGPQVDDDRPAAKSVVMNLDELFAGFETEGAAPKKPAAKPGQDDMTIATNPRAMAHAMQSGWQPPVQADQGPPVRPKTGTLGDSPLSKLAGQRPKTQLAAEGKAMLDNLFSNLNQSQARSQTGTFKPLPESSGADDPLTGLFNSVEETTTLPPNRNPMSGGSTLPPSKGPSASTLPPTATPKAAQPANTALAAVSLKQVSKPDMSFDSLFGDDLDPVTPQDGKKLPSLPPPRPMMDLEFGLEMGSGEPEASKDDFRNLGLKQPAAAPVGLGASTLPMPGAAAPKKSTQMSAAAPAAAGPGAGFSFNFDMAPAPVTPAQPPSPSTSQSLIHLQNMAKNAGIETGDLWGDKGVKPAEARAPSAPVASTPGVEVQKSQMVSETAPANLDFLDKLAGEAPEVRWPKALTTAGIVTAAIIAMTMKLALEYEGSLDEVSGESIVKVFSFSRIQPRDIVLGAGDLDASIQKVIPFQTLSGMELLVITGEAQNKKNTPIQAAEIGVMVNGKPLANVRHRYPVNAIFDEYELAELTTDKELAQKYAEKVSAPNYQASIAGSGKAQFMAVIWQGKTWSDADELSLRGYPLEGKDKFSVAAFLNPPQAAAPATASSQAAPRETPPAPASATPAAKNTPPNTPPRKKGK
ncbi:MAG: hypothetical protein GMKNLPBB_01000 [Myxococcota bacterium]|nr:hypothetical protein [Myxococcota bacterium]